MSCQILVDTLIAQTLILILTVDETIPCSDYRDAACLHVPDRCIYEDLGRAGYNAGYCRAYGLWLAASWPFALLMRVCFSLIGENVPCSYYSYDLCLANTDRCIANDVYYYCSDKNSDHSTAQPTSSDPLTTPVNNNVNCYNANDAYTCKFYGSKCLWSPRYSSCYDCTTYNCLSI